MKEDNQIHGKARKRSGLRRLLMIGGVVVVLIGCGYFYLTSGRYVATDDAYVKAAKILIAPQVAGAIIAVPVTDNQSVKESDVLAVIDPAAYKIAAAEASAKLANTYMTIDQLKAQYRQKREELAKAGIDVDFTRREYERRAALIKSGSISQTEFDDSKRQRDATLKIVASLKEEIDGIVAALAGDPDIDPKNHPLYQEAQAALHQAELDLERTTIKAPVDGIIGTTPHVGDYARAGLPLLNLIGTKDVWIEANYKETELTHVKVGQPVSIEVDTYPGHEWQGRVESISPATGSEFSVLPAQNATGNWVKVVQRIAVRIAVDSNPIDMPLRVGMSAHVIIDIGHYPNAF